MLSEIERQGLLDRCARELRRRALLVDPERLLELLELHLAAYDGAEGDLAERMLDEEWMDRRLRMAVGHALASDAQRLQEGGIGDDEDYRFLAEVFFLEPEEALAAAHDFHCLPFEIRRAFIELLLDQRPLEECLAQGFAKTPEDLGAMARTGLMALMRIDGAMVEEGWGDSEAAGEEHEE